MNRKILLGIMMIGLISALTGAALYAYFSDQATRTGNTFTAGTLDLKLSNDGTTWYDGVTSTWVSPTNWAPGEGVEATLYMKNDGTIGITHIGIKGENLVETGLADAVLITKVLYTEYWNYTTNEPGTTRQTYDISGWVISLIDTNSDQKGSLREFITWSDTHTLKFFEGPWASGEPYLKALGDTTQEFTLGFTFDPEAGDEYQGLTASFDLRIFAAQSYEQWPPVWWTTPSHGY